MSWIFFAIAAPAIYAASSFIDKFLIEKRIRDYVVLTIYGGALILLFGFIIFAVRNFPTFDLSQTLLIIAAGAVATFALLPYYKAISIDDVSRVIPLFQIIPIIVLIMSFLFLGETLTARELLGFWLVLGGGFVLSVKKFSKETFELRKSFWWAMLGSLFFAISAVIFRFVVVNQNFWDTLSYEFIGAGIAALVLPLIPLYRRRLVAETKRIAADLWGIIGFNEAFYLVGRLFGFYAIALAPVSLVSVLGGFNPFFALVYGVILSIWFPQIIKEDIQKSTIFLKILAIALIFGGVWFINL